MKLFGKDIQLRTWGCSLNGCTPEPLSPMVNLFVKVTKGCNARCLFCSNANSPKVGSFDFDKLFNIIDEIMDTGIKINRISITGGEPATVPVLVETLLTRLDEKNYQKIKVHLNTNGLLPESQILMIHERVDSISMSLHHYDLAKLSELYGVTIPEASLSFAGIDRTILNASCNLLRGYIDSPEEARKMMDFVSDLGIRSLGFVALMKVNDFCREHYVDIDDIHLSEIEGVRRTKERSHCGDCRCTNYLYSAKGKWLDIYMRNYQNPNYCESSLVYDGVHLRQGFQQDNVII